MIVNNKIQKENKMKKVYKKGSRLLDVLDEDRKEYISKGGITMDNYLSDRKKKRG